jgi:hypothetical protein
MIKRSLAALLWLCLSPLASWPIHILRRRTKPASQLEKVLKLAGGGLVGIFILIQFIPVSHDNPEVTQEVQWVSTETRALAQSACFDCHSNETIWPWYSYVAPASWFLIHHVEDGRRRLNFSEWDQPNENEREITKSMILLANLC